MGHNVSFPFSKDSIHNNTHGASKWCAVCVFEFVFLMKHLPEYLLKQSSRKRLLSRCFCGIIFAR